MLYDGRGYLTQAHLTFTGSPEDIKITPSYSSEGLLMSRTEERHWSGDTPGPDGEDSIWLVSNNETTHLFYFAGRPVAQENSAGRGNLRRRPGRFGGPRESSAAFGKIRRSAGKFCEPFEDSVRRRKIPGAVRRFRAAS